MHFGDFEVLLYQSQFLRPYWPNQATHRSPRHKKIKSIRYFIFFLNFDLDKGGASALLSSSLVAPLGGVVAKLYGDPTIFPTPKVWRPEIKMSKWKSNQKGYVKKLTYYADGRKAFFTRKIRQYFKNSKSFNTFCIGIWI